jgi:hypothetical protein
MRGTIWAVLAGAATMSAAMLIPAAAQTALQWKCAGNADLASDVQVDGCTAAIRSGKYSGRNLAWAYVNRGNGTVTRATTTTPSPTTMRRSGSIPKKPTPS